MSMKNDRDQSRPAGELEKELARAGKGEIVYSFKQVDGDLVLDEESGRYSENSHIEEDEAAFEYLEHAARREHAERSASKAEFTGEGDPEDTHLLYFDVWQDQDSTLIQEHGAPLPEAQSLPMILVAVLRAVDREDAWWQLRRLRPYEMPRMYEIWQDEWGVGVGVQAHPLSRPDGKILHSFWAETFAAAKEELEAFTASMTTPISPDEP